MKCDPFKAVGLFKEQNPITGGVEAANKVACLNLPLLTSLLNCKPVIFFFFFFLWHLDNHRKYIRKGLDQLEELDVETKTKFQLSLTFSFGYFKTQRESLQLS